MPRMDARRAAPLALLAAAVLGAPAAPAGAQEPLSLDAFGLLVAQQSRPSFSIVGAGARAAGMGGAFTALADDASAASFNPAGLALLIRPEASVVLDGVSRHEDHAAFRNFEGGVEEIYGPSSTGFDSRDVNFASFTVPFTVAERNLSFQLSYHRQIDFTYEGERSFGETLVTGEPVADLRQSVDQQGDVHTFSLAAAYQLTQRTSLGLTVSRWQGSWGFATETLEIPADGGEQAGLRFAQDNDWSGWNLTAGLLLRYRYLDFGAAVRSAFDGDYRVSSALATSFPTPFEPASSFDGTLHWPSSYTLGLAAKPLETWVVTADYTEYDWDDMVIEGVGDEPVNFFDLRPESESTTRNTGVWRFGTEVNVFPRGRQLALRGGWFDEPRPQLLAPGDEKSSNRGWTAGAGWKLGPVSIDLAYQRSDWSARVLEFVDPETVATGVVEAQAEGRVDVSEERWFVALLYQLDSKRPLRDAFHFLFVGPLDRRAPAPAGEEGGEAPGT